MYTTTAAFDISVLLPYIRIVCLAEVTTICRLISKDGILDLFLYIVKTLITHEPYSVLYCHRKNCELRRMTT